VSESSAKRILAVIASRNFRDEEYLVPRQVFDEAGVATTTCWAPLSR